MKERIITGAVLIALFIPLVIIGGIPFYILIALAIAWATFELMKATEGKISKEDEKKRCLSWPKILIIFTCLLTSFGAFYPYFLNLFNGNGFEFSSFMIPVVPFIILTFTLFGASIFNEKVHIQDVFMILAMSTFLMLGGQSVSLIRDMGLAFILFVLLTCFITDAGAYFVGYICTKNFKTHKLNERISPKKTIEGSIGGTVFGTFIPFLVTLIPSLSLVKDNLFGITITWPIVLLLAFIMSLLAQLGDLTFSAIKRHYEIKDYSQLFPGHGGVLDRLDSILFNMIFFAVIITTFIGLF